MAKQNEHTAVLRPDVFEKMPKAVLAAVAVSLAARICEAMNITTLIGTVGNCTRHRMARNCNEDCSHETALWLALFENDRKGFYQPAEWTIEKTKTNLYKVLGRPIRLADVLLAVHEIHGSFKYDIDMVERSGWSLRADDLEKQSEETINFLYELLK
jgi:hypothetical protein